jgi:DNA-binding MarR family transcriptional regulator
MKNNSSKAMKHYNHLHGEIEATYHEASLQFGISDSVCKILYTISSSGDSFLLNDICHSTGLTKQTVNSAIRGLENKGIVYLKAVDGKSKKVYLTEKGRDFAENTAFRLIEIENAIFESWSEEDVQKYLELTERFLVSLREKVERL